MQNNKQRIAKDIDGALFKIAIVAARFNDEISQLLIDGAINCLKQHNVKRENIALIRVPGSFEIPYAAQRCARHKTYHAIICLGAIIRGETAHFDYIAEQTAAGIMQVMLNNDIPIVFGVLTTNNFEQAQRRAEKNGNNKGWDAARTAIEMVNFSMQF